MDLDAIAHAFRPPRLRLDIGVLHEGRLEDTFGHGGAVGKGGRGIPALHATFEQQVLRPVRLHQRCIGGHGSIDTEQRRFGKPLDRHLVVVDGLNLGPRTDQGDHCLTSIARNPVCQHRLILDVGIDAETVERHLRRGQHCCEPAPQGGEIAQDEACPGMRRPHDPDPQRIAGNGIGPEGIAAGDLGNAVDPRDSSPYRPAGLGHRRCGGCCYRENGIHDLAVAGTAAEHTAQGIFDFGSCRSRRATDEFGGRHQHARRTDATLRRAVCQKGRLQSRQRLASCGTVARETFDRLDPPAVDLAHRDEAGTDLAAVEQHGTGPAIAGVAADLGAGTAEIVAQRRGQTCRRRPLPVGGVAVQDESHLHATSPCNSRFSRTSTASRR